MICAMGIFFFFWMNLPKTEEPILAQIKWEVRTQLIFKEWFVPWESSFFFFFFWWIFLKQKSLFLLKLNGKLGLSWYSRGNSKSPLLILVLLEFGIFNLICCYSSWLYDLSCSLPLFGRVDRVLLEWLFWFEFGYKINK